MIEEEMLTNEDPWQAFERVHRSELTDNPRYLNGYSPTFRKFYIDESLKALQQIASEDCAISADKD